MPVFGNALAVGDPDHLEAMADQRIERRAELDRLVHLRQHDAGAARRAVGDQHVLDRLALRRGVDDEQLLHAAVRQHVEQLAGARVALRHAGGVDEDHLLRRQQVEQVVERGAVVRGVDRHAEDAAIGAQLLVGADPVGVERDEAEVGGAVLGRERGRDLRGRRRLADAGRADQRDRRRRGPRWPLRPRPSSGCARARRAAHSDSSATSAPRPSPSLRISAGEKPQSSSFWVSRAWPGWRCSCP